jgi:hypothetical protein
MFAGRAGKSRQRFATKNERFGPRGNSVRPSAHRRTDEERGCLGPFSPTAGEGSLIELGQLGLGDEKREWNATGRQWTAAQRGVSREAQSM